MSQVRNYFQGLNTLRAIAAISVLVGHVELIKQSKGFPNLLHLNYFLHSSGHTGVVLFFVLSGFLITYLLLKEQKETNTISFKTFYAKRILRVWPLYFLIILLSVLIFQYFPSALTWLLCLTIFPNVSHALDLTWKVSPQLWSIGVEEQFYLVHPFIVSKLKKWLFLFLVLFFGVYTFLPQIIICSIQPSIEVESFLRNFFYGSKYNCMALGGICAILQMKYSSQLSQLFKSKFVAISCFLIPLLFWLMPFPIYLNDTIQICLTKIEVTQEVFAVLFGILILAVANNSFLANLIDLKFANYLGKISYGIYMFHWIIILLVIQVLGSYLKTDYFTGNILLYVISIGLTFLISGLSFKYFENRFLKIRDKMVHKRKLENQ